MPTLREVEQFWNEKSCGEVYGAGSSLQEQLRKQAEVRYELEPYISGFARFEEGQGQDVLEIGVGMGADHLEWAKSKPRRLTGVDLTERAVQFTTQRLSEEGFTPNVRQANAEQLPFDSDSFDIVYSWGVLHHSENPDRAISEVHRVMRTGGVARIMIYHKYSIVGLMLWVRYGLLRFNFVPLSTIYAKYLESPGTHAYSHKEARKLFADFSSVNIRIQLSVGDLMEGAAGQRHQGKLLNITRSLWPRRAIRCLFHQFGLFMMIEARK